MYYLTNYKERGIIIVWSNNPHEKLFDRLKVLTAPSNDEHFSASVMEKSLRESISNVTHEGMHMISDLVYESEYYSNILEQAALIAL